MKAMITRRDSHEITKGMSSRIHGLSSSLIPNSIPSKPSHNDKIDSKSNGKALNNFDIKLHWQPETSPFINFNWPFTSTSYIFHSTIFTPQTPNDTLQNSKRMNEWTNEQRSGRREKEAQLLFIIRPQTILWFLSLPLLLPPFFGFFHPRKETSILLFFRLLSKI